MIAAANNFAGISRVHVSNDGGLTFAPTNAYSPPETIFAQLHFSADGTYAYALATDGNNVHIFASYDGGQSWTLLPSRTPISWLLAGQHARLVGPNPLNREVIYYVGQSVNYGGANGVDYLVRSADGGMIFAPIEPDIALIFAAEFASDGTLYVATDTGIRKSLDGINFVPQAIQSQVIVSCLTVEGNTLYGCADESTAGFSVGKSTDDGLTWTPLLILHQNVAGPLVCGSATQVCTNCYSGWPSFASQLGLPNTQQPTCADAAPLSCPALQQPGSNQTPDSPPLPTPDVGPHAGLRGCAVVAGSPSDSTFVCFAFIVLALRLASSRKRS